MKLTPINVAFAFFLTTFTCLSHAAERIVTLSPHLTEWIYSLGSEDELVAVSAYSDFPAKASKLPIVADYQGVNFARLIQHAPTLVLAWEGGNRPQDISRLKTFGFDVFISSPKTPKDIATEIVELGLRLNKKQHAETLTEPFTKSLNALQKKYEDESELSVFYYSWQTPLMSIGQRAWPNKLLNICGANTLFADSETDYPSVSLQQVISRQPDILLSTLRNPSSKAEVFWQPHRPVITAPLVSANPDILSRFTLRLMPYMENLCKTLDQYRKSRNSLDNTDPLL